MRGTEFVIETLQKRSAEVVRRTKETDITIRVNLDEPGKTNIVTDLPFLSHMLEALACHGKIGIEVRATGDVEVDPHHLIEDVGIVLGEAIFKALGGLSGIERAGCFMYPMDGTLSQIAIDICGRRNLVWNSSKGSSTDCEQRCTSTCCTRTTITTR
jgi:imidazoleglycerol phosphate dehydratase HisB